MYSSLEDIYSKLDLLERTYRDNFMNSVDIEDVDIAEKLRNEAFIEIRNIKNFRKRTDELKMYFEKQNHILNLDISEIKTFPKTMDIKPSIENNSVEPKPFTNLDVESFKPIESFNSVDDSTDEVFTDIVANPSKLLLLGTEYHVNSWADVLIYVCEEMILRKAYIVSRFHNEEQLNDEQITFSQSESDIKNTPKRLSNGLFVETEGDNGHIYNLIIKILKLCNYSIDDLIVE